MISYKKLWKLLIDKGLNKKGQNVTTDVLCKICETLDCDFADIMEYIKK